MPHGTPAQAKRAFDAIRDRTHRYATLLLAELALILLFPFFVGLSSRDQAFRLGAIVVFLAALYAVLDKGRQTLIAFSLGTPAIVIRVLSIVFQAPSLGIADQVLGVIFMIYVTGVMVWTIVSDPSVTTDTLAGAISAYLLIGITFGLIYMLIEHLVPGSFRDSVEAGKHFNPGEFTFFSFVTLTTVGYGDIVPWLPHARSFAMLEAVIGIMYPALLISRLVGMHNRKQEN